MAGGAEFFRHLLPTGSESVVPAPLKGKALFVSGTTSESAAQFAATQAARGVRVLSLPEELAQTDDIPGGKFRDLVSRAGQELARSGRIILRVGLPLISAPGRSPGLAEHLVRWAAAVLEQVGGGVHIFIDGGATAAALAQRMRWTEFSVLRELSQGVVTLQPSTGSRLTVTLKPGSYSWPNLIIGPTPVDNSGS